MKSYDSANESIETVKKELDAKIEFLTTQLNVQSKITNLLALNVLLIDVYVFLNLLKVL